MRILTHCLWVMLGTLTAANARPAYIENVSTITNPDPAVWTSFPAGIAHNGLYALIGAGRWDYSNPDQSKLHQTAFLYRRSGNRWLLVRQLAETVTNGNARWNRGNVAMDSSVAVVGTTPYTIYELGPAGWTQAPTELPVSATAFDSVDLQIDNGRIINGEFDCAANAAIIEKAADGVWRRTATLQGAPRECDDTYAGVSADISNSWAVVHQEAGFEFPTSEQQSWVFRRQGSQWVRVGTAVMPYEPRLWTLHTPAVIRNSDVFVGAGLLNGIYRYSPVAGQFEIVERIRPIDGAMGGNESMQLETSGALLLQKTWLSDIGTPSAALNVYQRRDDGTHEQVAVLVKRGEPEWPGSMYEYPSNNTAIYGRTVLAADGNTVLHFELPATIAAPEPAQETFNLGAAPNWSFSGSSGFRTLRGDRSRVLRQTEMALDTRAIYQPADWTNQAIEVDVKATQFADADSAISLVTRWQNPNNYYELVFGPARFEFRRMRSGTLTTLVSYPGAGFNSIKPGQNRRLRLESIGGLHQVHIDGRVYLRHVSTDGPGRGRVGLGTYRAAADFDNVLITPSPAMSIYRNDFSIEEPVPWTQTGTGDWQIASSDSFGTRLVQYSTSGETSVTIGTPSTEQRVAVSARVVRFDPVPATRLQWFGVVARYVDPANHYVLAMRSTNQLVLTRRANGVSTVLGTFDVDFVPEERSYRIRLDAVGDELRAYLDDRLLFERTDATHAKGSVGLATYRAQAEFHDFAAYQP